MDIYTADDLQAVADLIDAFGDRAPSSNRPGMKRLGAALRDVAADARTADCADSVSVTLRF